MITTVYSSRSKFTGINKLPIVKFNNNKKRSVTQAEDGN